MAGSFDFTGRSALVTGAASGIGAAVARWLDAQKVARLVLVDRDSAALETLELTCDCERVPGDVADPALWEQMADIAPLDHAVVNAGVASGAPIRECDFAEWRRVLAVNLDGAFLALQAAMRSIPAAGSIVVTA